MQSTRICSVPACDREWQAHGLCAAHRRRRECGRGMLAPIKPLKPRRWCSFPECAKQHYAKGYCRTHHARLARHGTVELQPRKPRVVDLAQYIADRTEWAGDCLEWSGLRDKNGYGVVGMRSNTARAPRFVWQALRGEIPAGLIIRHKCDNPPCVRIEHLELGTYLDNTRDKIERGRGADGERNPAAKLTVEQVRRIREESAKGRSRAEVAAEFGMGTSQISRIVRGKSWPNA